jgi:hypothetical protein
MVNKQLLLPSPPPLISMGGGLGDIDSAAGSVI